MKIRSFKKGVTHPEQSTRNVRSKPNKNEDYPKLNYNLRYHVSVEMSFPKIKMVFHHCLRRNVSNKRCHCGFVLKFPKRNKCI